MNNWSEILMHNESLLDIQRNEIEALMTLIIHWRAILDGRITLLLRRRVIQRRSEHVQRFCLFTWIFFSFFQLSIASCYPLRNSKTNCWILCEWKKFHSSSGKIFNNKKLWKLCKIHTYSYDIAGKENVKFQFHKLNVLSVHQIATINNTRKPQRQNEAFSTRKMRKYLSSCNKFSTFPPLTNIPRKMKYTISMRMEWVVHSSWQKCRKSHK